jgi:hypothetical protein
MDPGESTGGGGGGIMDEEAKDANDGSSATTALVFLTGDVVLGSSNTGEALMTGRSFNGSVAEMGEGGT